MKTISINPVSDRANILGFCESMRRLSSMLVTDTQFEHNLINADLVLEAKDGDTTVGVFSFRVIEKERYAECLAALTDSAEASKAAVEYLRGAYSGFTSDWVLSPSMRAVSDELIRLGGSAYEPLFGYILESPKEYPPDPRIIPLTEDRFAEYTRIHPTDTYWTAKRVIASESFRVYLAVDNGEAAGYIDMAVGEKLSEPYDWRVLPEHRGKGLEEALLRAAITNAPSAVFVMTGENDTAEKLALEHLGFKRKPETDNLTIQLIL